MDLDLIDRTGLIREAYRIEGITAAECRSIFVDWALKLPDDITPQSAIAELIGVYGNNDENHPMTLVLQQGLTAPHRPKRRGGRAARVKES